MRISDWSSDVCSSDLPFSTRTDMAFMTRLLALIGVVMLAGAAAPAPQAGDWTRTVTQTAAGSFVMGNPAAPVKLIEYLSYTCPHCAAFTAESADVLRGRMVKSGKVSLEMRNAERGEVRRGGKECYSMGRTRGSR